MILCSPVGTLGATLSTRASATRQAVTAPHALSHLLMPTALAMRSLRSEVLMLEANMILEERGRRGWGGEVGWVASHQTQTQYTIDGVPHNCVRRHMLLTISDGIRNTPTIPTHRTATYSSIEVLRSQPTHYARACAAACTASRHCRARRQRR